MSDAFSTSAPPRAFEGPRPEIRYRPGRKGPERFLTARSLPALSKSRSLAAEGLRWQGDEACPLFSTAGLSAVALNSSRLVRCSATTCAPCCREYRQLSRQKPVRRGNAIAGTALIRFSQAVLSARIARRRRDPVEPFHSASNRAYRIVVDLVLEGDGNTGGVRLQFTEFLLKARLRAHNPLQLLVAFQQVE